MTTGNRHCLKCQVNLTDVMAVHVFVVDRSATRPIGADAGTAIRGIRDAWLCIEHGSNHANILSRHDYDIMRWADAIYAEIHHDMTSDYVNSEGKPIPADVGTFSELQDYVDANEYLLSEVPQGDLSWDDYTELLNEVSNAADVLLRADALALNSGARCSCGRLTRFDGGAGAGHYVHIDDLSHQCDACQFCLYCPRCHLTLGYAFDGAEQTSGFGKTYQCANRHRYVYLQGKMIDSDRVLPILDR